MPRFSIIITCYNQRDVIREAVDSALNQSNRDREIIVVDDGSTDGSRTVLERYAGAVTLKMLPGNEGAGAARNHGASVASGDYLVFLDGDDRLLPGALVVYGRVAGCERPGLILARMHFFRGPEPTQMTGPLDPEIRVVVHADYLKKDRSYRASASAMVIDRSVFELAGGWTPGSFPADDQDLLLKLGCSGPVVQIVSPKTSAYRLHGGNATCDVRPLVEAAYRLLKTEKEGGYPGGRERRFERQAVLGGFLFFLIRRTWRSRLQAQSFRLFSADWPLVCAAMLRRCLVLLRGRSREKTLT